MDYPEDLVGGLRLGLDLSWESKTKVGFIITDAPTHGRKYHDLKNDHYPDGSRNGLVFEDVCKKLSNKGIHLTFVRLDSSCDKMLEIMKQNYNRDGMNLEVTDLADAQKTKTKAEVTKMFVEKASFILKAQLSGGVAPKAERQ